MPSEISKNNLDNRKIKKEIDGLSSRSKKSQLKITDLIIPLSVVLILILLSLFVFVPMINTANAYRRELKEINAKLDTLESLEKKLNALDDNRLLADLLVSKSILPKILKVSDFVFYIDQLAQSKGLTTQEISAGDVNVGGSVDSVKGSQGVSGPLSYTGTYKNILDFLDEVQVSSPYLVTLKNISLSGGEDRWSVDFDLAGYYVPERGTNIDLYLPFTPYTNFSDVIDIFTTRSNKLNE
jgi:Tfp pilus assembly protein PilO